MITPFDIDPTSLYIFFGTVAAGIAGVIYAVIYQGRFVEKHTVIASLIIITPVVISGIYLMDDTNTQPNWSDAVLEEIKSQNCDELKADYEAYESVWAKEQITKEYIMDCVAVEDQMILEMLK